MAEKTFPPEATGQINPEAETSDLEALTPQELEDRFKEALRRPLSLDIENP